jgi:hypothetical protein
VAASTPMGSASDRANSSPRALCTRIPPPETLVRFSCTCVRPM